jgi:predicted PhzF superfamily epimerase YddE/YHI9
VDGRESNLSETTFLLPPRDERADYRVRIFTPGQGPPP